MCAEAYFNVNSVKIANYRKDRYFNNKEVIEYQCFTPVIITINEIVIPQQNIRHTTVIYLYIILRLYY